MRLSLIFFGLSSAFMIVSSLPLGSIGLEKRQLGGLTEVLGPVVDGLGPVVDGLGPVVDGLGPVVDGLGPGYGSAVGAAQH
ncbi:hypothetical protein G6F43_012079 [Rhizopus delemar]|nr:hypothetical protein G6F43_012079 [Rhizopus delemar]